MKFGQSENSLLQRRSIRLIYDVMTLVVLALFIYFAYYLRGKLSQSLFIIVIFSPFYLRLRRNIEIPPFEVKNDILYFKNYWGSIKEYPLKNFEGKIYAIKVFPYQHLLVAPGLHKSGEKIDISGLRKKERVRFIEYLKESVTKFKQNTEMKTTENDRYNGQDQQ